ncbi:MAG TPA: hypothetical protein VG755_06975, partial [Nannocystaceae bacterium]|nr:hypothetical protein [Nannocystaceae bacterium]
EIATRAQITLAWVVGERGDWSPAVAIAEDAVAMARDLRDLDPTAQPVELADALVVLAVSDLTAGVPEPPGASKEARELMLDALDDAPYDSRVLAALVRADDLMVRYDPRAFDALFLASEAAELARRIRALEPDNVRFVIAQLGALEMQATALGLAGDGVEALARFREALAVTELAARMEPDNLDNARAVAYMQNRVGDCLFDNGDFSGAERSYRESITVLEGVNRLAPWEGSRVDLGASHFDRGLALEELGRRDDALAEYAAAIAIGEELAQRGEDTEAAGLLAEALVAAAMLERSDRERTRARATRAVALLERVPHHTSAMADTLRLARELLQ